MIPLILRLKRTMHKEIAKAQDLVVGTIYEIFNDAVLHGGTAIWRCYAGNRFSEDIDMYIKKDVHKIELFYDSLKRKGFDIIKKKIGERSIYSSLKFGKTIVSFEVLFKNIKGILKEYETVEGNFLTVYSLSPEELIKEKTSAYITRLKVRDLYDIFFLLRYISNEKEIINALFELLNKFKRPIDEKDLKILILEGVIPDVDEMILYIKRRCKWE